MIPAPLPPLLSEFSPPLLPDQHPPHLRSTRWILHHEACRCTIALTGNRRVVHRPCCLRRRGGRQHIVIFPCQCRFVVRRGGTRLVVPAKWDGEFLLWHVSVAEHAVCRGWCVVYRYWCRMDRGGSRYTVATANAHCYRLGYLCMCLGNSMCGVDCPV